MKVKCQQRSSKWPIIQMMAVYTGLCLLSTYLYTGGIFYVELLEKFNEGEVKTNLVGSLNTALTCFLAPFVGIISTRFSCRISIIVGGILISTGLFLSAWASSIVEIIFYYGVISGTGNAMVGPPLVVVLGYYVEKHRQFFISMTASSIGIGMFIGTPAAVFLIDKYGISGSYILFSGILLHICIFGVLFKPSKIEKTLMQEKKTRTQIQRKKSDINNGAIPTVAGNLEVNDEKMSNASNHQLDCTGNEANYKKQLKSVDFILFLFGTFTWNYVLSVVQFHLPNHLKEEGKTNVYVSVIMSCFSISNAVGRLISALLMIKNRFDGLVIYVGSLIMVAICTATFPWYSDIPDGHYVFGVMSGLMTGVPNGVMPAITLKIVGLNNISIGYSVVCFFSGLGNFIGPVIASTLFEHSKSYTATFVVTGCVAFVGSGCSLIAKILQRSQTTLTS